jgi:hypothetical protein
MWSDIVVLDSNTSCWGSGGRKIPSLRPAWAKLVIAYLKNKIKTKKLGYSSSGRCLPSNCEALDSIPTTEIETKATTTTKKMK